MPPGITASARARSSRSWLLVRAMRRLPYRRSATLREGAAASTATPCKSGFHAAHRAPWPLLRGGLHRLRRELALPAGVVPPSWDVGEPHRADPVPADAGQGRQRPAAGGLGGQLRAAADGAAVPVAGGEIGR